MAVRVDRAVEPVVMAERVELRLMGKGVRVAITQALKADPAAAAQANRVIMAGNMGATQAGMEEMVST